MANWPARTRGEVFLHESFHIVQMRLGLGVGTDSAGHLDSVDGRYWMRLEWRALARALRESGDGAPWPFATRWRSARRVTRRFPDKVETERALDINERLASYCRGRRGGCRAIAAA